MKLYALNALSVGMDTLNPLKNMLQGVIGLAEAPTGLVSEYVNMEEWCSENHIDYIPVENYSLKTSSDREKLSKLSIDILIVQGWQRLIPDWLIAQCKLGALGAHGSAYGIAGGRGRSPQNWALMLGKKEFSISLFKIDKGIDSGGIIASRVFPYSEFDDIVTSYHKTTMCVVGMIEELLSSGVPDLDSIAQEQEGEVRYLPQRTAEDSAIDWSRSTEAIHNFVRALTKPYPCAFSLRNQTGSISVVRGRPFRQNDLRGVPGVVLNVFSDGRLLVKTGDGAYLVDEYEAQGEPIRIGEVLQSVVFAEQMAAIVQRHQGKYPDLPIVEEILELADISTSNSNSSGAM